MKEFPNACILLDENDQVIIANPAAEKLLKRTKSEMKGQFLGDIGAGRVLFSIGGESQAQAYREPSPARENGHLGFAKIEIASVYDPSGNHLGEVTILRARRYPDQQVALQNQNEMLVALQETTFDLHSSLELDVVLQNILKRACKLLETGHAYLVILREPGKMVPVVGFGALAEILKCKINLGEGLAGIVWKTARPLFIPDLDLWPERLQQLSTGQIRATLGMPLILNGQVVGVIVVARGVGSPASFSEEDIVVLRRFAALAVLALQNARLFEQAKAEIAFRRKTEMELRDANQVLQFQIERIELLQKQLEQQALRDSLTDLFNRRYLQESLSVEFARANRSGSSLAILMMDCDRLKYINDTYGHKAGDDALMRIANVIRESTRAGDIACRYGGDEFVVVLSNVPQETALQRAENLRSLIESEPILHEKGGIEISISVGIAMYPAHGTQGEALLHKADQALYAAKHRGKNLVLLYNESLE